MKARHKSILDDAALHKRDLLIIRVLDAQPACCRGHGSDSTQLRHHRRPCRATSLRRQDHNGRGVSARQQPSGNCRQQNDCGRCPQHQQLPMSGHSEPAQQRIGADKSWTGRWDLYFRCQNDLLGQLWFRRRDELDRAICADSFYVYSSFLPIGRYGLNYLINNVEPSERKKAAQRWVWKSARSLYVSKWKTPVMLVTLNRDKCS